jgi:hypothetical protein
VGTAQISLKKSRMEIFLRDSLAHFDLNMLKGEKANKRRFGRNSNMHSYQNENGLKRVLF